MHTRLSDKFYETIFIHGELGVLLAEVIRFENRGFQLLFPRLNETETGPVHVAEPGLAQNTAPCGIMC